MNCLVTAGPTFEPLDDVRRLTNFSTGRLGTELANHLTAAGHRVTLLIGESATYSGARHAATVRSFATTADLHAQFQACSRRKVDSIFHAAAVSDFTFGKMFIRDAAGKLTPFAPTKKISTRGGSLLVELVPTEKILAALRGWFPAAKIFGWKYEADGRRADAVRAATRQLAECATDFCVANGPAYGAGFSLVSAHGKKHFSTAAALFAALEKQARA